MSLTITDLFCGAGGSSIGAVAAGAQVVIAANHWKLAVETHNANHPTVDHDCADISQVDPRRYPKTDVLWASPSCTNHSIAKASARLQSERAPDPGALYPPLPAEAAERSRATMWDVVRFAEHHKYASIVVENVVEVARWVLFDAWLLAMHHLGYDHETVWLNSMFAGATPAPQSRDRIYVVFHRRGDSVPDLRITPRACCPHCGDVEAIQSWKKTSHAKWGRYRSQYLFRCVSCARPVEPHTRPAATAIDWTLPGQRIGDRNRPLAEGTMRRIQAGIDKFSNAPVLIPVERNSDPGKQGRPTWEPLATQTARATTGLAIPFITTMRGGGSKAHAASVGEPLGTFSAGGNHHGLVVPDGFVMRNNGSPGDGGEHCTPFSEPLRTLTTLGHQSVVTVEEHMLVPYYGNGTATPITRPMGTQTTVDTHALVSTPARIEDCSFRMLQPHEVQAGMAFPESYQVLGNKRERVRQLGNAVTPPAAALILERVTTALGAAT